MRKVEAVEYMGFKIKKHTSGNSRHGELFITYPDGSKSIIEPASLTAAKNIINTFLRKKER